MIWRSIGKFSLLAAILFSYSLLSAALPLSLVWQGLLLAMLPVSLVQRG